MNIEKTQHMQSGESQDELEVSEEEVTLEEYLKP
jgi:hypothetical protein